MSNGSGDLGRSGVPCRFPAAMASLLRGIAGGWLLLLAGSGAAPAQHRIVAAGPLAGLVVRSSVPPNLSSVGVNLPAIVYYDLVSTRCFTDVFKASDTLTLSVPTDPLRSDFYPASLTGTATTTVFTDVFGRYVGFSDGDGTFTVNVPGEAPVVVESRGTDHRFEFDVPVIDPRAGITVSITRTNPADPLHGIRLVMPGFEHTYRSTDLFHPSYLEAVKLFSVLRFMNAMQTNNSTQEDWDDRPRTTDQTQSRGMALEHMIALCNRTGATPWFTLPHLATTDYVTRFATTVFRQLRRDVEVYVEYSNETWCPCYQQFFDCGKAGYAAGFDTRPSVKAANRWHAHKTRENGEIFRAVFGGEADRIVCVNAGQMANFDPERLTWEGIDQMPNLKYGVAPYFSTKQTEAEILAGGVDSVLDATQERLTTVVVPYMISMAQFAESHNHKLIAYEYNTAYIVNNYHEPDPDTREQLMAIFTEANSDPRMTGFFRDIWLPEFKAAGGEMSAAFRFSGITDVFGDWGIVNDLDDFHTARYEGILEFALSNPRWW